MGVELERSQFMKILVWHPKTGQIKAITFQPLSEEHLFLFCENTLTS